VIETLLSFVIPGEGDRFAVDAAGELGKRADHVCIIGDKTGRLDEDA
jgi:hypothetical protein